MKIYYLLLPKQSISLKFSVTIPKYLNLSIRLIT